MATVRKFQFDTDFDGPSAAAKRRARSFAESEVEQIKRTALEEGEAAGRKVALATIEAEAARALEAIARDLAGQAKEIARIADESRRGALDVALAVCRKMLPALAERGACDEIARVVGEALGELSQEPRVVVRVTPTLVEPLQRHLQPIEAGFAGKIVILGDEAIAPGNCAVIWANGGVERDTAKLMAEIEAAVARHLALPIGASPEPASPVQS